VHQFGFRVDGEGASTQQASRWQGFRLTSADGRYIAQFNQDGLVFSRLAPYENWERFAPEGRRLWRVFCGLGAISEIQRLGVRFINRIPLGTPTDVNRFLRRPPQVLKDLNLPRGGFLIVTNHDLPHEPLRVEIIQTIQPPAPPATYGHGLILDIDVITTSGFPCGDPSLDKFLVTMHWLKNKVFFALITDEAVHLLAPERP
jgi:uncharacterized protein (TIGR04255 family)